MGTPRRSCLGDVVLHLPEALLDKDPRQTLCCDVEELLVRGYGLVLANCLCQSAALDLTPETKVQEHGAWNVWGEFSRLNLLLLLSLHTLAGLEPLGITLFDNTELALDAIALAIKSEDGAGQKCKHLLNNL